MELDWKGYFSFKMMLAELLMVIMLSSMAESATVKTTCDSDAVIGQPSKLTCQITGNIDNGLRWFKSGFSNSIIVCSVTGTCVSYNSTLYSTTDVVNEVQKLTLLKVTENDLTTTWTCRDGTLPPSSCKLTQKTAETTTGCDIDSLNVGKPFTLTCNIKGTVVHGINWFRDKQTIITCKKNGECSTSNSDIYKTGNINGNTHQLTILDVTEEDLKKTWTCVDVTSFTDHTSPRCNLKVLIDEARGASVGSSIIVAVLIVIIDVVLYLIFKDYLSGVMKIYIIYCVIDIVIVGIIVGVTSYYIYLRTSNIGIIAGLCVGFLAVSTVIKLIVVKTKLFSKCSSSESSDIGENHPM